jgi:hypothetical protein
MSKAGTFELGSQLRGERLSSTSALPPTTNGLPTVCYHAWVVCQNATIESISRKC